MKKKRLFFFITFSQKINERTNGYAAQVKKLSQEVRVRTLEILFVRRCNQIYCLQKNNNILLKTSIHWILNWTKNGDKNLVPTHKLWTYQLAAQPFLFSWRFRFGHRHHCCLLYVVLFYEAFPFVFSLFPEVELVYKVVFFLCFSLKSEKVVFIDWSRGVWWWVLLFKCLKRICKYLFWFYFHIINFKLNTTCMCVCVCALPCL